MKWIFLFIGILFLFISCQTVPECQKNFTSDLTMTNKTGVKLEVMLEMREPDGDYHYGTRVIEVDSYTTYKRVKEGHIRLSGRVYGTEQWFDRETYNVRCHDHDFIWRWDFKNEEIILEK